MLEWLDICCVIQGAQLREVADFSKVTMVNDLRKDLRSSETVEKFEASELWIRDARYTKKDPSYRRCKIVKCFWTILWHKQIDQVSPHSF